MVSTLKKYFPMIRTEKEIEADIKNNSKLLSIYQEWTREQQEDFLKMTAGMKGVKVLYDAYFKEVFNPETKPERLEAFLSLLLKQKIKIRAILSNDNSRLADESSLLIMDILVELEDGSFADVEAQKIGYKFPGQRCACYSADLLLRQYKRIRDKMGKKFSYRDIKNILIPLDIFRKNLYNRGIRNQLDAWLTFLSVDDVEWIEKLIQQYPEFVPLYKDVYMLCANTENVMGFFSEELKILDRNTVQLMIDEMQDKINMQEKEISRKEEVISQKDEEIAKLKKLLGMQDV